MRVVSSQGAPTSGSCKDCYVWGVIRKHKWLCWRRRLWRTKFELVTCLCCGREITIGSNGACRLCWRQATSLRWTKTGLSLSEANRHGQQLFLANLHQRGKRAPPRPCSLVADSAHGGRAATTGHPLTVDADGSPA